MPYYIQSGTRVSGSGNCNDSATYCRDTSSFFSKLATKLLDMAVAINKRIEDIKTQICAKNESGVLLASIEAPTMMIAINIEVLEYIKRFGPPSDGIFDKAKLQAIRDELGISSANTL